MKEKILIVEDNHQNMRLIEMTLRAKNHLFLKASDGEQAIEMAVKDRPDLIIIDIQLPGLNGLEVTERLRQIPACHHVPVVAVTAYATRGNREQAIDAGCDAYLSKPIDTRQLRRMVADILLKQHQDNAERQWR
jgi:CheY-like chemotaxis protein